MTLDRMLRQQVTIERRSAGTTDAYGNQVATTSATKTLLAYLQPTATTEVLVDRETYLSDHLLVLPPDTEIDGSDRVVHDGRTYELVGPPMRRFNPRTRSEHHLECNLRLVQG